MHKSNKGNSRRKGRKLIKAILLSLLAVAVFSQPLSWEYAVSSAGSWVSIQEHQWGDAVLTEHPSYSPDSTKVLWTIHRPFTDDEKQWILGLDSTAVFIPSHEIGDWLNANGWEGQ